MFVGTWILAAVRQLARVFEKMVDTIQIKRVWFPQKKQNQKTLDFRRPMNFDDRPQIELKMMRERERETWTSCQKGCRHWNAAAMFTVQRLVQCPHRTVTTSNRLLHGTLTCTFYNKIQQLIFQKKRRRRNPTFQIPN